MDYVLEEAKRTVKIIDLVRGNKRQFGNRILINPCPVCKHRDHFYIYPDTNSYSSYSECCRGGTVIDYFMEFHGMDKFTAISHVIELSGLEPDQRSRGEPPPKINIDADRFIKDLTNWSNNALGILARCWRNCRAVLRTYKAPEQQDELFYILLELERELDGWTDILVENNLIEVFRLRKQFQKKGWIN